ncbi:UNVERIFIED_CONTAM: hypothetical protein FKN15_035614 [Acipenser sinensis]
MDHTNEQQKMLELKRQEIAEQKQREREIQQQVLAQDEETVELRETYSSLQQEVEIKTKKLKKIKGRSFAVSRCIHMTTSHSRDCRVDFHVHVNPAIVLSIAIFNSFIDLAVLKSVASPRCRFRYLIIENFIPPVEKNKIMNRLVFDGEEEQWKFQPLVPAGKYLIIENFIPPVEKNKIMNRLVFDGEEEQWKFQPLVPAGNKNSQMKKRPASAVGYKRPISQFARVAIEMGAHPRYRAENIMFLELDMTPPTLFELEFPRAQPEHDLALRFGRDLMLDNSAYREHAAASRVKKSRSW